MTLYREEHRATAITRQTGAGGGGCSWLLERRIAATRFRSIISVVWNRPRDQAGRGDVSQQTLFGPIQNLNASDGGFEQWHSRGLGLVQVNTVACAHVCKYSS